MRCPSLPRRGLRDRRPFIPFLGSLFRPALLLRWLDRSRRCRCRRRLRKQPGRPCRERRLERSRCPLHLRMRNPEPTLSRGRRRLSRCRMECPPLRCSMPDRRCSPVLARRRCHRGLLRCRTVLSTCRPVRPMRRSRRGLSMRRVARPTRQFHRGRSMRPAARLMRRSRRGRSRCRRWEPRLRRFCRGLLGRRGLSPPRLCLPLREQFQGPRPGRCLGRRRWVLRREGALLRGR